MQAHLHLLRRVAVSLLLFGHPLQAAPPGAPEVRVAVRTDAPPFIWKDPVTGKYAGFLWHICTEAVQRAGYRSSEADVDAAARSKFLEAGTGGFDLLCDPTTITLRRAENFATAGGPAAALEFSPIIFVANASYVENRRIRTPLNDGENGLPPCRELISSPLNAPPAPAGNEAQAAPAKKGADRWIGWLENQFKATLRPQKDSEMPEMLLSIWGYVGGTTSADTLRQYVLPDDQPFPIMDGGPYSGSVCLKRLESHREAATAFCEGELTRYYGDIELVRAAISLYEAESGRKCHFDDLTPEPIISYEPYAFVVSSRLPDFPERFALALYGMFADGTVERLFNGHFPDLPKSSYLTMLFDLNSIPSGMGNPKNTDLGSITTAATQAPEAGP